MIDESTLRMRQEAGELENTELATLDMIINNESFYFKIDESTFFAPNPNR